jgi:hypothetical protein
MFLETKPDLLRSGATTGVRCTKDLISCTFFHVMSIHEQVAEETDALITGSAGEDILGHFCRNPQDEFWGQRFSIDRYYDSMRVMTDAALQELLTPETYQSIRGLARARFHADFGRYSSIHTTNQIDYWSVRQQQRRLYNRLSSLFPKTLQFRPLFYDNDLVDFVQTIPPSKRWGGGSVYKQVLLHTAPELAQLPFTTTNGLPLTADRRRTERRIARKKYWRTWYFRARRLSRGRIPSLRMSDRSADYGKWFQYELRDWVESILLDTRTLDRGYWNQSAIVQMIRDLQRGKPRTRELATLISLELWTRVYLDASHAQTMTSSPPSASDGDFGPGREQALAGRRDVAFESSSSERIPFSRQCAEAAWTGSVDA